jgi:predicted lipoprotein
VAVACLLAVLGCSAGDDDATSTSVAVPDRTEVVAAMAGDVIVPGQERLVEATTELADTTESLCAEPTPELLDASRESWGEAQDAWASTAAYRLGPIRPLRLTADIEYPVDVEKVDELLAAGTGPITSAELDELGADLRGLNAVQELLFRPADVTALDARACSYAAAAAELSAAGAGRLRDAWTVGVDGEPPYVEQFSRPGDDSMWADTTEVLEDVVNTSLSALTTVADMRLGPLTGSTAGEAAPEDLDGPAGRALEDALAELGSVRAVVGDGERTSSLAALVGSRSPDTVAAVEDSLDNAVAQLEQLEVPLADAAAEPATRRQVEVAEADVLAARGVLRTEVASQLGLTITFSDSDGDG